MKTGPKTPLKRVKAALEAVRRAKEHIVESERYFPSATHLVILERELQAYINLHNASFPFGANVASVIDGVTYKNINGIVLKCWHDNELKLDGPQAKCGCKVVTVHDDIHVVTKERR